MPRALVPPFVLLALCAPAVALAPACRALPAGGLDFPRARAHEPRVAGFDVLSYGIELEVLPETRSIRAECRVRLRALAGLAEVELDLAGLTVEGVTDERGRALSFQRAGERLAIRLAEPCARAQVSELAIRYSGTPERGLWFAGERLDGSGPTLVFSHGQTEGSRGWFPCFDEPSERATVELELTLPSTWSAIASGERVDSSEVAGTRRVERWRMDFPHPTYLFGLVAGELTIAEGRAGEVPLLFAAEPHLADFIEPTFAETDEILAFLAEYTDRPYPYPKYSQAAVDNFPWGGMENISATTLTPLLLSDERGLGDQAPHFLIAHEAAHQWFGNLFTCADWSHLWLNEGFATYFTLLYLEHSRGVDEFRAEMRETQEAYLAQDSGSARRPTVWNVWKEPDDAFGAHAYQGAAARLHLLRFVLGEEGFRAGVRAYVRACAGKSVTTADFQRALEGASGRDLGPFFAQWLLRPGFPELALAWSWDEDAALLRLTIEQVQEGLDGTPEVFMLPAEIEVGEAAGAHSLRVELDERRERFELPCATAPLYVLFDPHGWIPKRVRCEREPEEWLAIARVAEDVNARREAVLALGRLAGAETGDRSDSPALAEVLARLERDSSPWVRADAASALSELGGSVVRDALARAAREDEAPRVRTAALHALRAFGPDAGLALAAEEIFAEQASYQLMGAAAALLCRAAPERGFDFVSQALEHESPHGVLAAHLALVLAQLPDARVPAELRHLAADEWLAPAARATAVDALASTTRERPANARFVAGLLAEESFHLRRAALRALASFDDPGSRRALRDYYPRARTPEERRIIESRLELADP